MDVILRLNESGTLQDLLSLQESISIESNLRGRSELQGPTREGTLGSVWDCISVIADAGGAAALSTVLVAWLRNQRTSVTTTITRKDGSSIVLSAKNVQSASPSEVQELVSNVAQTLRDD